MSGLAGLRNLGPTSANMLADAGIITVADLRALGSIEAWQRVSFIRGRPASLLLLYALDGALTDYDWRALPSGRATELRAAAYRAGER